ncbi:MAG TPA: VOC family protein [Flavisolibacter sp.]
MKIRLHEIELGAKEMENTNVFFQSILGLRPRLQQRDLTVFDAGIDGLDLNVSRHLLPGAAVISFLTDDLDDIENKLKVAGIAYEGPAASHLGMRCIQFLSPDGCIIKVNTPSPESPDWLKV